MTTRRRRKCRHCGQLFRPDPRNLRHQRYCSAKECRRASKAASQRRWLAKAENRDYFRGPEQMARVREPQSLLVATMEAIGRMVGVGSRTFITDRIVFSQVAAIFAMHTDDSTVLIGDVRHGIALGVRWAERPSKHIGNYN